MKITVNTLPASFPWNHNTHYYPAILRAVPHPCRRALDVGCGDGTLSLLLTKQCDEVIGIDRDAAILPKATHASPNVAFLADDALTHPFDLASFDFITAVAILHHLPLTAALQRLDDLLRPGGTLMIVGLYRPATLADYALQPLAWLTSRTLRLTRRYSTGSAQLSPPTESLIAIIEAASAILPGAHIERRLLFRYSLVWHKPLRPAGQHPERLNGISNSLTR